MHNIGHEVYGTLMVLTVLGFIGIMARIYWMQQFCGVCKVKKYTRIRRSLFDEVLLCDECGE